MKKWVYTAGMMLAVFLTLALVPSASALSGYTFEKVGLPYVSAEYADTPSVRDAYNKLVQLTNERNATADQLNAMDLRVTWVTGKIISTSPFTIEYKSPTSEYVKVNNDYIYVTTYYYATIENPEVGNQGGGYYGGFHVETGRSVSGNTQYIHYGSCGDTFNNLRVKLLEQTDAYYAAYEEFDSVKWKANGEMAEKNNVFSVQYEPIFAEYLSSNQERPQVAYRKDIWRTYTCGATVFKIDCPAYVTSHGSLKAIEYDVAGIAKYDTVPVAIDGSTMIPIRPLIDGLTNSDTAHYNGRNGASVIWDGAAQKVTVQLGTDGGDYVDNGCDVPVCMQGLSIELTLGSSTAYLNGEPYEMPQPVQVINGKTMIPLRAVSEMLNCHVEWIQEGQYIVVTPKSLREIDPFWGTVTEAMIDGEEYYHVSCDSEFWGCEYTFPKEWGGWELNSAGVDKTWLGLYGEEDRVVTYRHIQQKDSWVEVIDLYDLTSNDTIGLTIDQFCEKYHCFVSGLRPDVVIGVYDEGDYRFYHLAIENGLIGAVTQIDAPSDAGYAIHYGEANVTDIDEDWLEENMDEELLDILWFEFLAKKTNMDLDDVDDEMLDSLWIEFVDSMDEEQLRNLYPEFVKEDEDTHLDTDDPWLDESQLDPYFVILLKSFQRDCPSG